MPSRRSDRGSALASAVRRGVPANMRVFAGSMLGDESPITEKNFNPEELQAMRAQIIRRQAENADLEEMYRTGNSQTFNADTGDWVDGDFSKEIASFDDTRGKTAISYDDYELSNEQNESSLLKSFTDPEYSVQTTLGRYVAHQNEDGSTTIKDVYDWNDADVSKLSTKDIFNAFANSKNARHIGNLAARLLKPNIKRPVEVNLGHLEGR